MSTPARDDEGRSQGRRAPREDGATFAVTRVRSGRTPRSLAFGALLAIGGLIAIGVLDRVLGPEPASPVALDGGPTAAPATAPGHGREEPGQRFSNRPPATGVPVPILEVMQLDLRPAGSRLFVHGDVYSIDVTTVVVSIEDRNGHVAESRSLRMPGGSTALRLGPNTRFDTLFDVPDELMGEGLLVRANALDAQGRVLVALAEPVVAPVLDAANAEAGIP